MISQTNEYALRVIVFLADRLGQPVVTRQIAAATRVPEGYLAKVLQTLGHAKLVKSQRGLHGGFVLTREPAQITVLDVINAVDPLPRITTCPLGLASHGTNLCPLHRHLDNAYHQVEQAFGNATIADLLAQPGSSRPLCEAASKRPKSAKLQVSAKRR